MTRTTTMETRAGVRTPFRHAPGGQYAGRGEQLPRSNCKMAAMTIARVTIVLTVRKLRTISLNRGINSTEVCLGRLLDLLGELAQMGPGLPELFKKTVWGLLAGIMKTAWGPRGGIMKTVWGPRAGILFKQNCLGSTHWHPKKAVLDGS